MKINDYDRVLAVGDIHGHFDKLQDIWEKMHVTDNDLVIFLGDYIDRGSQPLECLRFIQEVSNSSNVIALAGNHEIFMRDYFIHDINRTSYDIWLDPRNGGEVTHDQLMTLPQAEREALIDYIYNLSIIYTDIEGYVFVHAGVNPSFKINDQLEDDLIWIRDDFFRYYDGDDIIIVGHTPTQYLGRNTPIILQNNIIMVDTGAAMDEKVSAIDVKTKKFIQSI